MSDAPIGILTTGPQTLTSGAAETPVTAQLYPAEGPRSILAQYAWPSPAFATQGVNQYVDRMRGGETTVQALYIDNSGVGYEVSILVLRTGQNITVPANSQGFVPLIASEGLAIQVTAPVGASGATRVNFLNVPCNTAGFWYAGLSGGASGNTSPVAYANPTFFTVPNVSTQIIPAGQYKRVINLQNTAGAGNVWLSLNGTPAIIGSGIQLSSNGGFAAFGSTLPMPTGAINAISDAGNINISIQGG